MKILSLFAIAFSFVLSAASPQNPNIVVTSATALSAHKVQISTSPGVVPSGCSAYVFAAVMEGGLLVQINSNKPLSPTVSDSAEFDGLAAQTTYAFNTATRMQCGKKSTATTNGSVWFSVTTPADSANTITATPLVLLEPGPAITANLTSPGTFSVLTSIDGIDCFNFCSVSDVSNPNQIGSAIDNETAVLAAPFVADYSPESDGSRKLRFDYSVANMGLSIHLPHIFQVTYFDFLGGSFSEQYAIPAQ